MNLELLETGKRYKYKDLCDAFGFEPKTGNTKKKHMSIFEQHMKLEKDGTWFTVVEIYNEVQERVETRGRKVDIDLTDVLLLAIYFNQYVVEDGDKLSLGVSKSLLWNTIGLCNENYSKVKRLNAEDIDVDRYTFRDFFSATNSTLNSLMESNLKVLQKKHLIVWEESSIWYEEVRDVDNTFKKIHHLCTTKEQLAIQKAKYYAVEQWNDRYKDKKPLRHYGDTYFLDYYSRIKFDLALVQRIRIDIPNYNGSYSCYKISFDREVLTKELIKRGFNIELDKELYKQFEEMVDTINEKMVVKVIASNSQRYNDSVQRVENSVPTRNGSYKGSKEVSKSTKNRVEDKDYVDSCDRLTYASISKHRMNEDIIICVATDTLDGED